MATINKTIASSGGDYTSLSLAEASIPGSGADDYIFTYIEALSDTTAVTISFGGTNTMTVDVQDAYRAKGAVSGAHAELAVTGATAISNQMAGVTIKNLRISSSSSYAFLMVHNGSNVKLLNNTFISRTHNIGDVEFDGNGTGIVIAGNYFIHSAGTNKADIIGLYRATAGAGYKLYRNKIFIASGVINAAIGAIRVYGAADVDAQQNIVIKAAGATMARAYGLFDTATWNAASDSNVSSDTTTPGTNENDSESPGDVFTTLTVGSENLDYPSRTKMQEQHAGNDLSATVGATDIKGRTINVWYPGADYVNAVPTLSGVSPDNGPAAGGTAVTLTGTNFTDVTGVTFGGDAATNVSVVSDTSITCDTPAHAAGAVSVLATNADGSNTANSAYTYNAAAANTQPARFGFGFGFGF